MPPSPEIRPATPGDIRAIRVILAAHGNDGPVTTVDVVGPYVRHLVEHHRAMVSAEAGDVVAFGAVVDAGVTAHLADLFVRPDRLGQGIGRPLLDALFADAPRRTTFASDDPRALPLYVRAGMRPLWVGLYLEGEGSAIPEPAPGLRVVARDPAALAALEGAWTGAPRPLDHAFWASQADADAFIVTDDDDPVAIGYARARQASDVRALDRLVVRPDADPVGPVLAACRRTARGGRVHALVAGPSPVLPVLLDLRFRIVDRDQFMASDPGLVDPARLLANGGML